MSEFVQDTAGVRKCRSLTPWLLQGLWVFTLLGLLIRAVRQTTLPGTYSIRLDELLYGGQRLLEGQLLFQGLVNGGSPLAQWLYAPSAWIGSLQAHRLLLLALSILSGALLAQAIRNLGRAGLIALANDSPLPWAAAFLYVTLAQTFPEAKSGLPEHFSNAFLVLALFFLTPQYPCSRPRRGPGHGRLVWAGAAVALALMGSPGLVSPTVMVATLSVVFFPLLRSLAWVVPMLVGAIIATLLVFAPYGWLPDGLALAWAGTLQLPLEEAGRFPGDSERLLPMVAEFLRLPVAGLPIWLLALLPVLALSVLVCRLGRQPFSHADRLLLLPALALLFSLEILSVVVRHGSERETFHLLVIPLVLTMVCGFAVMEHRGLFQRRASRLALLVLSLIFFNNVFLASVLHAPRQPNAHVRALEVDREATRRLLLQHQPPEGFTAPQDVALLRQLHQRSSTTGIGPDWSLNHRQLKSSWATRKLTLPTASAEVCRQLTDPSNRYVVWMRTDPEGPNTEAFFRSCLNREPGHWQDISSELRLSSGEYRVFRRRSAGPMSQPTVLP